MTNVPDPPTLVACPKPEQTAGVGPLGGPSYKYRGATIDCQPGGYTCTLRMPDYPFHGWGLGSVDVITMLVDLWLEQKRMPKYMRVVPPARQ